MTGQHIVTQALHKGHSHTTAHSGSASPYTRSVWIKIIFVEIENWKYYNKIIFKCVNSTVGPIFNIFKYVKSTCTVCKQCMHCSWTVNFVSESQYKRLEEKKKKKKKQNARRRRAIQTAPKPHATLNLNVYS